MFRKALFASIALAGLSACSSVLEGTSQEIVINTNPPGANCALVRENIVIARVSPTPGAATIKKTKHDITVECEKESFQKASFFNKSDVAGATVGNIILGGGIGWAIDSASGADNKYTSPVNITLVPTEMAAGVPAAPVPSSMPAAGEPVPVPVQPSLPQAPTS